VKKRGLQLVEKAYKYRFEQVKPPATSGGQYFPEIDGLRAIAVVSVLLYHLDANIIGGGFVGVDVFFVISGYLITDLLLKDIHGQTYSLFRFYQRRIARIAPAALLVIAATLGVAYLTYSAQDLASAGSSSLAAALSFINIKLLFQGSYFKISPDAQPLIHYWSLALEEQFYILFPLLLFGVMRLTRYTLIVLLAILALSLAASVIFTPIAPIASFYLLPTRAWELLAGSCLAAAKWHYPRFASKPSSLCIDIGLAVIVAAAVLTRSENFPGWIAVMPVLGSTVFLAGVGEPRRGVFHRAMAHPVMVFVGKRSYSLYLWHWPIFSIVDYHFYLRSPAVGMTLKIVIPALAAILTFRFIETPLRHYLSAPQQWRVAWITFAGAALIIGGTGYVVRSDYYLSAEPRSIADGGILINGSGHGSVAVIGDSQGAMYGYELASLARANNFRLNVLCAAGRSELPGDPDTLWPMISRFVDDNKPDIVILAQAWSLKFGEDADRQFGDIIASVRSRAKYVIVLTEPPAAPPDANRHAILTGARPPFREQEAQTKARLRANAIIRRFENDRVVVIDVAETFLDADGAIRLIAPDGRLAYHDGEHLSSSGTALVRPALERVLRSTLR
jgi:peptidoglycan/LPS O-acetylase OafA/YrhL